MSDLASGPGLVRPRLEADWRPDSPGLGYRGGGLARP